MIEQRQRDLAVAFRSLAEHLKGRRDDPGTASKLIDDIRIKAELLGYFTEYAGWLTKQKKAIWVVEPKTGYRARANYPERTTEGLQTLNEISAYRSLIQWAAMAEQSVELKAPYRRRKFFGFSALNTLMNEEVQIVRDVWSRVGKAGVKPIGSEFISDHYEGEPGLKDIELLKSAFSIDRLSEFVGYKGGSKIGLLGAAEKWVANIEPKRGFEGSLAADPPSTIPKVDSECRSVGRIEGSAQSNEPPKKQHETSKKSVSKKSNGTESSQFVTPKIICEKVGVGIDCVLGWIHTGALRASNISSSSSRPRWRIAESDLADFLAVRSNQPSKDSRPVKRRRSKPTKKYV